MNSEPSDAGRVFPLERLVGRLLRLADVFGELRELPPLNDTSLPAAYYVGKQDAYRVAESEVRHMVSELRGSAGWQTMPAAQGNNEKPFWPEEP